MSLTADYETEIRVPQPQLRAAQGNVRGLPCIGIMRQAFETIAREQGGSVTEDYEDCNGKPRVKRAWETRRPGAEIPSWPDEGIFRPLNRGGPDPHLADRAAPYHC